MCRRRSPWKWACSSSNCEGLSRMKMCFLATPLSWAPSRIFHAWRRFGWVARATRPCRSATRRPEPSVTQRGRAATKRTSQKQTKETKSENNFAKNAQFSWFALYWSRDAAPLPRMMFDLPPGQWPGGTGESPVLPRNYEKCGLGRAFRRRCGGQGTARPTFRGLPVTGRVAIPSLHHSTTPSTSS